MQTLNMTGIRTLLLRREWQKYEKYEFAPDYLNLSSCIESCRMQAFNMTRIRMYSTKWIKKDYFSSTNKDQTNN
jgi:hypothetical protein